MRLGRTLGSAAALLLLLTACGSDGDVGGGGGGDSAGSAPRDLPFTTTVPADPGELHPHLSTLAATRNVVAYMYDKLVYFNSAGEELPWLAESWEVGPDSVTYTIKDGVTCTDGSSLTASDVAANFEWVVDPANQSPIRGIDVPSELEVSADDEARTVTVSVEEPDPFLLHMTGELFIACRAGLEDPSLLKTKGIGTGMYELTEAVPNDHYTFQRREDYVWGPDGAAASEPGTAASVTLRVIENESTAVNLFLAGELDVVSAVGPDRERLAGKYEEITGLGTVGEVLFNQSDGHPGADPQVREALALALNYEELMAVITGGFGQMSKATAVVAPTVCDYDAVSGNLPEQDVEAAKAALDAAGWIAGADGVRAKDGEKLSVGLTFNSTRGDTTASAAELITESWRAIGVDATPRGMPPTEYNEVAFGTGDWDAGLLPINVRLPNQLVPFFSGTTPPDGVNFAHLDNDAYEAAVAEAMELPGEESCGAWQKADEALITANDLLLFADETIPTFLDSVTLEIGSQGIVAPTIRMSAQ